MNAKWKRIRGLSVAVLLVVVATQAQAQITYVDASDGNTTVNGNPMVFEPTGGYNMSDDDDAGGDGQTTEWMQRDPFANGGNAFETKDSPSTDVLNTSVSGLDAGTYRVYAYFWDSSGAASEWDLAAELNSGGYLDKAAGSPGVVTASNQSFTASVLTTEGNRTLYAVDLGTFVGSDFTVNAKGGTAAVVGGGVTDVRTWYDGVGYTNLVLGVPTPEIVTLSPTNNATGVLPDDDLVATFTVDIFTNTTGSIVITNLSDNSSTTLAIGDTSQVAVSGAALTISPTGGLSNSADYAVLIDTNALKNIVDDFFAGITNATTWTFTTAPPDLTAPTLDSADIVDDRGGASVAKSNVVTYTLTFSEEMDPVSVTTGDFTNVGSSAVFIGTPTQTDTNVFTVAVTPTTAGSLHLRVSSDVTDLAGNPLAGDVTDGDVISVEEDFFDDLFTGSGGASAPGSFASDATTASAKVSDYIVDHNSVSIVDSAGNVGNPTPGLNLFGGGAQTNALHLNLATVEGATYSVALQASMWGSELGTLSYALSASAFDGADTVTGTALGSDFIDTATGFTMEAISFSFVAVSTATTLYIDGTIDDTVSHDVWIDNLDINEDLSTVVPGGTVIIIK